MEKAYIILAHKSPKQLLKLITRLDDNQSVFFIHIDKRSDLKLFKPVFDYSEKVQLVNQVFTNWGSLGLVKATLNALQAVYQYKLFDRIILLSGQDYPIKSNDFINRYFRSSGYSIFMDYTTIPDYERWQTTGGKYRVNKYFFGLKVFQRYAAKAANLGAMIVPALRRKMPAGLNPYAGSQWWIIDDYGMKYILNYVKNNPEYTQFHKHTFAPDEIYFQTILLNSNDPKIKQSIKNSNLMYTNWLHASSSHPEVIAKNSVDKMLSSTCLFARKFEQETDNEVFDLINKHSNIANQQTLHQD